MSGGRGSGLVAILVSLLAVGVLRSALPEGIPTEFEVRPDEAGTARAEEVTVQFLGIETATSVRPDGGLSDARFDAAPGTVLVLCRVAMTAHGGPFVVSTQVRTADGYSYEAVYGSGVDRTAIADVGTTVTTTYVYMLPLDKVSGRIALHGFRPDGLQPVHPTVVQELPSGLDLEPGEVVLPPVEIVAAE
ncbi:MAG: hypothetical protein ABIS84_07165 [Arachnia sp.]